MNCMTCSDWKEPPWCDKCRERAEYEWHCELSRKHGHGFVPWLEPWELPKVEYVEADWLRVWG